MRPAESSTTCDRNASGADNGGFCDTRDDHEKLIRRPKDVQDNAIPSGSAMATHVLLKLGFLTGDTTYWDTAKQAIRSVGKLMAQYPLGFGEWLNATSLIMGESREIALAGGPLGTCSQRPGLSVRYRNPSRTRARPRSLYGNERIFQLRRPGCHCRISGVGPIF